VDLSALGEHIFPPARYAGNKPQSGVRPISKQTAERGTIRRIIESIRLLIGNSGGSAASWRLVPSLVSPASAKPITRKTQGSRTRQNGAGGNTSWYQPGSDLPHHLPPAYLVNPGHGTSKLPAQERTLLSLPQSKSPVSTKLSANIFKPPAWPHAPARSRQQDFFIPARARQKNTAAREVARRRGSSVIITDAHARTVQRLAMPAIPAPDTQLVVPKQRRCRPHPIARLASAGRPV